MLKTQLIQRGISEDAIIDAFSAVEKEDFVPVTLRRTAYTDVEIALFNGVILRSFIIAKIIQFVFNLENNKSVLIIGDVSGYTGMLFHHIFQYCVIGTVDKAITEYLRNKTNIPVLQIYDIKKKFDVIFFDAGIFKNSTVIEMSNKFLKPNGCFIKMSRKISSEFSRSSHCFFNTLITATLQNNTIKILETPLLLNDGYIA